MARKPAALPDDAAYGGRWIARLQGRIVGQGGTPEAAKLAAQANRHKEKPEISYMHSTSAPFLPGLVDKVAELSPDQDIYLVGGAVRDALLGRVSHDFDFAVPNGAIPLARRAANTLGGDFYVLDEEFDAARVIITDTSGVRDVLDFTSYRGKDVNADLRGRDLTINAIALDLNNRTTLDPLNGATDLRERRIRECSPTSMKEDPIRILRAVRLAAALEFRIEPATRRAMKAVAESLESTSVERQRDEVFRMLGGPRPDASIRALEMLGIFPYVVPELSELESVAQSEPHIHDVWEHTLSVMQHLDGILNLLLGGKHDDANGILASLLGLGMGRYRANIAAHFSRPLNPDRTVKALMQFAALYHDVGKPRCRSADTDGRVHFYGHEHAGAETVEARATAWNLSNAETARVRGVVGNHLRFFFLAARNEAAGELPSRMAIYRFFRDANESAIDVILLGLADLRGTRGHNLTEQAWAAWVEVARILLDNLWEKPHESITPPRLVDGHDLMQELTLEPGPLVGELLEAIREAQATGEVATRAEALEFARRRNRST
jgi:tRNA nucleotidyltransferase/poly(A) polymerase